MSPLTSEPPRSPGVGTLGPACRASATLVHDGQPLPQSFFARNALEVARDLIGCTFLFGGAGGRIVETEAYRQDDPCCHGYRGKTDRNAVLFGPPGPPLRLLHLRYALLRQRRLRGGGRGGGRASARPRARARRRGHGRPPRGARAAPAGLRPGAARPGSRHRPRPERPARLAAAPGDPAARPPARRLLAVVTTARIGVRGGDQKPWRFVDAGSRFLSRPLTRTPILPAG